MPTFAEQQERIKELQSGSGNGFVDPADLIGELGFLDAFPAAQRLKVGDDLIEVNPLSTEDYVPWCGELTQKLQADRLAVIGQIKTAKPEEVFKMTVNTKETEVTPDDVAGLLFRPTWTERIILKALDKAGVGKEQAEKFYKSRPARANEMLGILLSGLWTLAKFNQTYEALMPAGYGPQPARTFGQNSPFVEPAANSTPAHSEEGGGDTSTGLTQGSGSEKRDLTPVS